MPSKEKYVFHSKITTEIEETGDHIIPVCKKYVLKDSNTYFHWKMRNLGKTAANKIITLTPEVDDDFDAQSDKISRQLSGKSREQGGFISHLCNP